MLKQTEKRGQRAREAFKTLSAPWYKPPSYTKLRTTKNMPIKCIDFGSWECFFGDNWYLIWRKAKYFLINTWYLICRNTCMCRKHFENRLSYKNYVQKYFWIQIFYGQITIKGKSLFSRKILNVWIIFYPNCFKSTAFVAESLQGHWWGFISRNYVVWPIFFLMNVFIALKGTHFWILFAFTAAGVVKRLPVHQP